MFSLAQQLIDWHKVSGRHHLPWQRNADPYAIWLSEIMLQQTQVSTVIPYYLRFMQEFPGIDQLAQAPLDSVLALWSGLGYYSRARNLHRTAQILRQDHCSRFPDSRIALEQLPGIGRSTAAAIAVFAFGHREAILDGNVKRILTRYFGITGYPAEKSTQNKLWQLAEQSLPIHTDHGRIQSYTQALMDLGATVCLRRNPICAACPLQSNCTAHRNNLTHLLPAPKPRKPMPEKEAVLLFLVQQHKLLLRKRPAPGIWGGLWCPPEIAVDTDALTYCQQQFGMRIQSTRELPAMNHQFTHYKLRIYPKILHVTAPTTATDDQLVWLEPLMALHQGIPAPVKKLLNQNFIVTDSHAMQMHSHE